MEDLCEELRWVNEAILVNMHQLPFKFGLAKKCCSFLFFKILFLLFIAKSGNLIQFYKALPKIKPHVKPWFVQFNYPNDKNHLNCLLFSIRSLIFHQRYKFATKSQIPAFIYFQFGPSFLTRITYKPQATDT